MGTRTCRSVVELGVANLSPPYFWSARVMTSFQICCRTTAACCLPAKYVFRRFTLPDMLPTHTTVATFVLAPSIQVLTALSVVPVFPMFGMPVPVLDALAVPPLNVCCRAYVIAAATSSLTACEHFDAGGVTSLPSAFMILSIAIGVQNRPLFAMPAKAVAMVSGETYSVPSTAAGGNCSSVPSAWRTLNAAAVCLILHRSSCWAMDTNALLTEYFVAARAVFAWVWSSFSGL